MSEQHEGEVLAVPKVRTDPGREAIKAILADPEGTVIGLDFDGTIAPIVPDPERAHVDPAAVAALSRLGALVKAVVVITGRPVRTAVRLGGFRDHDGLRQMTVLGQYGVERWDAADDRFSGQPEPPEIAEVEAALPDLLAQLGLSGARTEHKGRAIGVHTRELPDPGGAFTELLPALSELATAHGLRLEPGKYVLEIRAAGSDKGDALRDFASEVKARQIIFIGDDLGDLPAFDAVRDLRDQGTPGLLICSASDEQDALADHADLIATGPSGVAAWLTELADALDQQG
ncbi:trehalose-phosphatase [Microlunatus elymi]|uniref:Trehalose 6-phosphate phosphatase n=1 Tax=Microlunatus elymi TaxID=2596828 RepID=A0A516PZ07_9ACTN|nr:trehalose-phosphatase [Microlunatus elymi]QDP96221.1 trehalose-phosphatase [Microlunatus elymi]